ncbi:alpha/beta hydrolase [Heyndrickxia ginsengihumi]|uniref:Alpha/beta hydrolase n=1 Tax=Heyndrickxia ginsengihumi TaxID=363870 RepID=A0A0A6VCF2_9BACI|nr:alpha/beta hydrolase [Heyndrickxia ginsengihumi]KHD85950.1 phospholipase [Heyndrickxia ginsengihumi]MBE6183898.1 alpha/beta hydrolase [Bacillus sp. (in: firmicutes)]MCM3022092.1 alpha/beta hydrolase [Heyndrickxia ginsengihumi]NEY21011.1 alpha/beta hydrolase [Heyndrickxia ginsengihumi]
MWIWRADENPKAVIVMVHGAMEHHGRYSWLIEMWRSNGYNVVMGDLPGQGMTSRSQRGYIDAFDEYIIELKEWVQAAYQFDLPIFLLGHSMGGLAVIRLLQEEHVKVAGVILSGPCLGLVEYPNRWLSALSVILDRIAPRIRFNSPLTVQMATRNREIQEMAVNDSLYITKISVRWYRELIKAMRIAHSKVLDLPDIPFLVMQGGDDRIVKKTAVMNWFNQTTLSEKLYKEWPKCYHEIFNEPEREDIFIYTKNFVDNRLRELGYIID